MRRRLEARAPEEPVDARDRNSMRLWPVIVSHFIGANDIGEPKFNFCIAAKLRGRERTFQKERVSRDVFQSQRLAFRYSAVRSGSSNRKVRTG